MEYIIYIEQEWIHRSILGENQSPYEKVLDSMNYDQMITFST